VQQWLLYSSWYYLVTVNTAALGYVSHVCYPMGHNNMTGASVSGNVKMQQLNGNVKMQVSFKAIHKP
jgi:hypothetical protein